MAIFCSKKSFLSQKMPFLAQKYPNLIISCHKKVFNRLHILNNWDLWPSMAIFCSKKSFLSPKMPFLVLRNWFVPRHFARGFLFNFASNKISFLQFAIYSVFLRDVPMLVRVSCLAGWNSCSELGTS